MKKDNNSQSTSFPSLATGGARGGSLRAEMLDTLSNNILPFWIDFTDEVYGGFHGRMTGDGQIMPEAPKGAILNARILWAFSAAFRVTGKAEYLASASYAKDYILEKFYDHEYGGVYWATDCKGNAIDTKKQFYAIGFMIYGFSEYARAVMHLNHEDTDLAMEVCVKLFDVIEEHSFDPVYNGYIEACTRDWGKIEDMRLSDLDANYPKSQNTHLHIIEPYANLYRCLCELEADGTYIVDKDFKARVEKALRNLIDIFCDKILNPETHHLDLFFEMDWTRAAGRLESYGHDIECSWLLHEAALVLGDKDVLAKVEPVVQLVAKASEKGLNADGSMTHEANLDTGYVDSDRHWWVQAETVVGFYNIYQHFGDESALQKALNCWQYIKDNLIDHKLGEWYWSRDADGNINRRDDHAGFWKCPYHNSRMCLELIERIK